MADKLTKEERAMIEAAIARGVLQVIPRGVSGVPDQTMSWRESVDRSFANIKRGDRLKSARTNRKAGTNVPFGE